MTFAVSQRIGISFKRKFSKTGMVNQTWIKRIRENFSIRVGIAKKNMVCCCPNEILHYVLSLIWLIVIHFTYVNSANDLYISSSSSYRAGSTDIPATNITKLVQMICTYRIEIFCLYCLFITLYVIVYSEVIFSWFDQLIGMRRVPVLQWLTCWTATL